MAPFCPTLLPPSPCPTTPVSTSDKRRFGALQSPQNWRLCQLFPTPYLLPIQTKEGRSNHATRRTEGPLRVLLQGLTARPNRPNVHRRPRSGGRPIRPTQRRQISGQVSGFGIQRPRRTPSCLPGNDAHRHPPRQTFRSDPRKQTHQNGRVPSNVGQKPRIAGRPRRPDHLRRQLNIGIQALSNMEEVIRGWIESSRSHDQ